MTGGTLELLQRGDLVRDETENAAEAMQLPVQVAAEAGIGVELVGADRRRPSSRNLPSASGPTTSLSICSISAWVSGSSRIVWMSPCRRILGGWPSCR